MTDGDFGKPIVAIANSYTQFVPLDDEVQVALFEQRAGHALVAHQVGPGAERDVAPSGAPHSPVYGYPPVIHQRSRFDDWSVPASHVATTR